MDSSRGDRRDAAGIGPYARDLGELSPMSSLDGWSVSKGEPDIRSWEVRTVSGRTLGSVRDLLVDQKAGEVVMIDIDIAGSDRHIPVPIRVVQIDRQSRIVLMDSADLGVDVADPAVIADNTRVGAADREIARPAIAAETLPPLALRPAFGDPPADRVDPDLGRREAAPLGTQAERRRAERRRIDRMGTDT